jgi:type I restriction enzyme, S subunit
MWSESKMSLPRLSTALGNRYITEDKFKSLNTVEVKAGDVLITMMGTIGEVCVVPSAISKSIMDSHLLRFRPNRMLCSPEYVSWLIKGSKAVHEALGNRAHGAIMKGLNSSIIRSLPAPLPPLAEQTWIVKLLHEADALRKFRAEADSRMVDLIPAMFNEMFGDAKTNPKDWPRGRLQDFGADVRYGLGQPPALDPNGVPHYCVRQISNEA